MIGINYCWGKTEFIIKFKYVHDYYSNSKLFSVHQNEALICFIVFREENHRPKWCHLGQITKPELNTKANCSFNFPQKCSLPGQPRNFLMGAKESATWAYFPQRNRR